VVDSNLAASNTGGSFLPQQTVANVPAHCSVSSGHGIYNPFAASSPTPCAFENDYDGGGPNFLSPPTNYGQSRRNQTYGPGYTDTDLDISKSFHVPHWDQGKLKIAGQFFNLLNHPNFAEPAHGLGGGSSYGYETGTVNTPTSILGAFFTGASSRRLIQAKVAFEF
jgi:hypothetical protein